MNIITEKQEKLCEKAIKTFGAEDQINMVTEECGELLSALNKYRRGRIGKDDVITEIADVLIMCVQLAYLFGYYETQDEVTHKISRLSQRITERELKEQERVEAATK